jgi:hypothetical protein
VYRCPELRLGDENVKINVEVYDQFRIVVTKIPTVYAVWYSMASRTLRNKSVSSRVEIRMQV